jgi:hypothetical protein
LETAISNFVRSEFYTYLRLNSMLFCVESGFSSVWNGRTLAATPASQRQPPHGVVIPSSPAVTPHTSCTRGSQRQTLHGAALPSLPALTPHQRQPLEPAPTPHTRGNPLEPWPTPTSQRQPRTPAATPSSLANPTSHRHPQLANANPHISANRSQQRTELNPSW